MSYCVYIWQNSYPHRCLPVILPLTQMSLMASVYCTILMSFERYVRICHLCQLRYNSWLSEKTFGFLIAFVTVFPICFYMPRFFEMRSKEDIKVCKGAFKNYVDHFWPRAESFVGPKSYFLYSSSLIQTIYFFVGTFSIFLDFIIYWCILTNYNGF